MYLDAPGFWSCYYPHPVRRFDASYVKRLLMNVDYEYVDQCLTNVGVDAGASGAHGMLCGLICAGEKDIQQRLSKEWFSIQHKGDYAVAECRRALDELTRAVHASIDGVEFGFPVLLPDEDSALKLRAAAVRDWCEGFLYGVGLVEAQREAGLPDRVKEALKDLAEISRMDVDGITEDEGDEVALSEVTEFIWVAAMLIHDELVDVESGRASL